MKQLSQVEILSLTAILKAESDGLKMQRALNTVITVRIKHSSCRRKNKWINSIH